MNRATVNKIFQKHPVYVKAGMIAVISIIIFGCVYSKDNGKKLEKDEKGREILRRNESGKDELKNMKVKIDEKQEDISISVSGKKSVSYTHLVGTENEKVKGSIMKVAELENTGKLVAAGY